MIKKSAIKKEKKGFSLIEIMVAVSIFSIVMLIGVGALLSLVDANRRAQGINSVINNLNAALESMSRSIRVGTNYYCQSSAVPPNASIISTTASCPNGGLLFAFESSEGDLNNINDQVVYRKNGTQLERSKDSGATWVALTAPEVSIDSFNFYLVGADSFSENGDVTQPRVLMKIKGTAEVPGGSTEFNVQTTITQRIIDI